MDAAIRSALLELLQRGIVDGRLLALAGESAACADLLDALDNIPRHLANWNPTSLVEIERQLESFDRRRPSDQTRYLPLLQELIRKEATHRDKDPD